ncbi:MAG: hypothetical protein JXR51_00635 [Bacteroidales bacterium]|nr:hypothetical protein [Bacteroidales bacterium]MBN2755647.1 hypothetical protein [Bacteroidales bacterium]
MNKKAEKKSPMMERAGIWYLKKINKKTQPERIDYQAYILDNQERDNINRIEKQAIINVVIAGTLSSIASGLAAFFSDSLIDENASIFSNENLLYWGIVIGVTILASLIEIIYIYYDVMAKTHALAVAAHMELFPKDTDEELIAVPIVRAALELPNKKEEDINIDPRKESSKIFIVLATIFYKLKISVSNFILKALVKRMLGRAISRAWLSFISVPVCAFWNGIVCWMVIREVKIRVLGPSAVNEILNKISISLDTISDKGKLALLRAIGSSIVRTADLHPNLEYMYRSFSQRFGKLPDAVIDDTHLFLAELNNVPDNEKEIVLQTLVFACIIDGKVNYREKNLLVNAFKTCNIPFQFSDIDKLRKHFRNGQLLDFNLILK